MSSGGVLYNIVFFILAIGTLVAFHEFGHYWVARRLKVKVLRFSIGFGKPLFIWKKKRGEDLIEFVVAAIPLGGYVKMLDEREGDVDPSIKHRAFNTQPVASRFAIVAAGPLFNFLLAIIFYFIFFLNGETGIKPVLAEPEQASIAAHAGFQPNDEVLAVGSAEIKTWNAFRIALIDQGIDQDILTVKVKTDNLSIIERKLSLSDLHILNEKEDVTQLLGFKLWRPEIPPIIGGVTPEGPSAKAGLRAGDLVISINDQKIENWHNLVKVVKVNPAVPLNLLINRDGQQITRQLTPDKRQLGDKITGFIGVYPELPKELMTQTRTVIEYNVFEALLRAIDETWTFSALTLKVFGKMLMGEAALENISGPITIAQYAGVTASLGFLTYIKFLAMISISLGVLNLLPVPMLDGGHLMYYLVEIVKGSPVSQNIEELGQKLGLTLLFLLMSLAVFNDIQRLIS